MTVHHAVALMVEFFESYLKLIISSRDFLLEQAKGLYGERIL